MSLLFKTFSSIGLSSWFNKINEEAESNRKLIRELFYKPLTWKSSPRILKTLIRENKPIIYHMRQARKGSLDR